MPRDTRTLGYPPDILAGLRKENWREKLEPKWAPFDDATNPGRCTLGLSNPKDKLDMGPVLYPSQLAFFRAYYDRLNEH
jgi:hypothetical protein